VDRKQKSILAENPAGEPFIRLDYVMPDADVAGDTSEDK